MPFNIILHTVHKDYAVQYHGAYSTQTLCHSISCCIQYTSIMPFNIKLQTVCRHYAVQYHAAYSIQALCHSISCCIQYASIMLFNIFFFLCKSPLTRLKSHCSVRGYKLLLQQKLIDPPLECCEIVICWKAFIGEGVPNGCGSRK